MKDVRNQFPYLKNNPEVVYFDSAATSLKPQAVIDRVMYFYTNLSSNIHRGEYDTSTQTEKMYEGVRAHLAKFFNVGVENVVFTKNASESLNMVATGFLKDKLQENDVILVNEAEHASNLLPWYKIAEETGAKVEFMKLVAGKVDLDILESHLKKGVKLMSLAHVSNVVGVIQDIAAISKLTQKYQTYLCVDGAQSVGHFDIDLKTLNPDFFCFSAHKMFGPSGVGVLISKKEHYEKMIPLHYGGGSNSRFDILGNVTLKDIPFRFESGTPNLEGVLGLGAALDFIDDLGLDAIHQHEVFLRNYLLKALKQMDHILIYNPYTEVGIVSFNVKDIPSQDVAFYLNAHHINVRSGNHCAKLIQGVLETESSIRISLSIYNTIEDIDKFIAVIQDITLEKTIDLYI